MTHTPETPNTPESGDQPVAAAGNDAAENAAVETPTEAPVAPDAAAPAAQPTLSQPTLSQPTAPQATVPQPPAPLNPAVSNSTAATVPLAPVVPTAPPATPPAAYAPPAPQYGVPPQSYQAPAAAPYVAPFQGAQHQQHPAAHAQQPSAQYATAPQHNAEQPPAAFTPDGAAKAPKGNGASFRRTSTVGLVAALAIAALVGGVSGAGVMLIANGNGNSASTPTSAGIDPTSITINDPDDATTITAVAAKAAASVVTISVSAGDSGGTGSGVVLTADGYILTNTHVVTLDGASADGTIQVQLNDGRLYSATIVGTDPISDLAVIKVKGATDLQPADFADSSKLNVGDTAIAIGAPLGLSGTVTDGIVSALNRSITIASSAVPDDSEQDDSQSDSDTPLWGFDLPGQSSQSTTSSSTISLSVVQTDAAINPGNSGGALLNAKGEIIGINVAIASAGSTDASSQSGNIGVGFAIPANLAKRVSDEIIANGSATHGLLGASVADVTAQDSDTVGAVVKEIVSGGAAADAGLKAGDVITNFNGLPITGSTDLTAQVRALAAGASAQVTYVRGGAAASVSVTLGELEQ